MQHKHCELIKAWAEGAEIEFFNVVSGQWESPLGETPLWINDTEYRIKSIERYLVKYGLTVDGEYRTLWAALSDGTKKQYSFKL